MIELDQYHKYMIEKVIQRFRERTSTYNKIKEYQLQEKELSKCKCNDENNILVPYEQIVKASQMLYIVGEHGNAVLDSELREQMILLSSTLRKIYMNMKGE